MNVQASTQLTACEGARVVILCDIDDDDGRKQTESQAYSQNQQFVSNFKTVSRTVTLHGM